MTSYQTGKLAVYAPLSLYLPDLDVLKRLVISDSGFIFDPLLGKSYSTNQIGLIILKSIQGEKNLNQIIDGLIKEFNVSRENAERDIIEFIGSLQGQMK